MSARVTASLFLLASLLIGLAQIALLPPFEGFDEPAHLSYIAQIAILGDPPGLGDHLWGLFDDYRRVAPTPYVSTPPFDRASGWTYAEFFAAGPAAIARGAEAIHAPQAIGRPWRFGETENWEIQHPPLYYRLLVPLYRWSEGWSLLAQLSLLRAASYLLAWLGLCVATATAFALPAMRDDADQGRWIAWAPALWPFLFPEWFPTMARLGNDSLIVLVVALVWAVLMGLSRSTSLAREALLGLLCGIGLLTKATFAPLVAAIAGITLLRAWRARGDGARLRERLLAALVFGIAVGASAGWWYARNLAQTGQVLMSTDLENMAKAGGPLAAFAEPGFLETYVRSWLGILISFSWAGTWSFVKPPSITVGPIVAFGCVLVAVHAAWLRRQPLIERWFPFAALVLFLCALGYHSLGIIAAYGKGATPGWYLHSIAPAFAFIVGTTCAAMIAQRWFRIALTSAFAYALLLLTGGTALNALAYGGCPVKSASGSDFGSVIGCVAQAGTIVDHLAIVASPFVFIASYVAGCAVALVGFVRLARRWRPVTNGHPRSRAPD